MLRKSLSIGDNLDADELRQEELEKLLKQYHIIEGSKSISTIANRKILYRQMNELAFLENEKHELQVNLFLTQSPQNQAADNKIIEEIKALMMIIERKDKEIYDEVHKQHELNLEIVELEKKTMKLLANTSPGDQKSASPAFSKNKIRNLESRLQKMLNDFGTLLAKNKNFRRILSDLCFQQKKFESHRIKIAESITTCRTEIAQSIASSTSSLEAKDEYSAKTAYLKEKYERDEKQHLAEMRELSRIIDHEKQLKKFMSDKTAERHDDGQMVAWRQEKVAKAAQKKLNEKDSLETLEEASNRIKQLMETENVEQIIKKFDEREESNFALFKFVNEQNNKLDKLANEIEEITQETRVSKKDFDDLEAKRQNDLAATESQLSRFKKVNNSYTKEIGNIDSETNLFIKEIEKIFGGMDCEKNMPKNSFGEYNHVTKKNVVKYMQAIEERLNQLIMIRNYIQIKDSGSSLKLPFDFTPKKSYVIRQSPPILSTPDFPGEDDNISHYEIRPLSRNELQNRIHKKIQATFECHSAGNRRPSSNDKRHKTISNDPIHEESKLLTDS